MILIYTNNFINEDSAFYKDDFFNQRIHEAQKIIFTRFLFNFRNKICAYKIANIPPTFPTRKALGNIS